MELKAQGNYSLSPNPQCYNPTGAYTATAEVLAGVPGATSYTWQVIASNCAPTWTSSTTLNNLGPGFSQAQHNVVSIDIPCCGEYTVVCFGWDNGFPLGQAFIASAVSGNQPNGVIYCPNSGSISVTNSAICLGNTSTLTIANIFVPIPNPGPPLTYTWSTGHITPSISVNPTQNTCYTYTATVPAGCTISPAASCVSVQAITSTVTPPTQTMCVGAPVHFTASATPVTGPNYAPGTTVTNYQWINPNSVALPTGSTATDATPGGTYSVVITHTGQAGTCTHTNTAIVTLSASIPVTITPSSPSVCPGFINNLTLTATSAQTLTGQYTWYRDVNASKVPTLIIQNGNPIQTFIPGGNPTQFPRTYSVHVNYFGCPGDATISIGLLSLTPTLVPSALTSCPGKSLSLTASGGLTYTFTAWAGPGPIYPTSTVITNVPNTNSVVAHTPQASQMPIQYCVGSASTGCTGTTCIVVDTRTLTPTLTPSTPSICPATQFTLMASGSGSGAGSQYTFSSNYSPNIGSGTSTSVVHTATGANSVLPQPYTVVVDSAGCKGTATTTLYLLNLQPILSSSSPSICAGTQLTLTTGGVLGGVGPASQYTFYASHPGFDNGPASTLTAISNTAAHTPPGSATLINYTVHVDSAGCTGTGTHTVGILDLGPTLTLTPSPLSGSVCPGSTVTIKALGAINYTFLASGGPFSTGTGISRKDTVAGTANVPLSIGGGITYTVQGDSSTCVGSTVITIREFKIKPSLVVTPTLVCKGMPIVLSATNVGSHPSQPTTYTFAELAPTPSTLTPPGNVSYSFQTNPIVKTTYLLWVDSMGCTAILPSTGTVDVKPDLVLQSSTSAASVCPGLSATVSVATPTSALSYTYTWSQVSGTGQITPPPTTASLTVYPFTNSTYSVQVLDSLGCVGNTIISVGIDPAISFSINMSSSGSTICPTPQSPQTVTLTASSTVTPVSFGPITYTWTPLTGVVSPPNGVGPSIETGPTITTVYQVFADNGYGCVSQNTIQVPVGTIPSTLGAIVPTSSFVCKNFTSTLTAFGANSYSWTGSTFTGVIAQQAISVPAGTYQVILSNGGGCTATAQQIVYPKNDLTITITPSNPSPTTCITNNEPKYSKPIHLTASGAGTYVWIPYNPLHMTYSLGPQTDVRPPTTTNYTIIGSTAVCSGTGAVTVVVIPQFTITVVPPLPALCLGDSLQLDVAAVGVGTVGPVSSFTYQWKEALNAPPISISNYMTRTVSVWPQQTTTYTTEVKDSRACVSMPAFVQVTVLPQPLTAIAIPTINSVASNTVCFVGLNPGAPDVTINLIGYNTNGSLPFGVVPTYTWLSPYTPTYNTILTPANSGGIIVNAPIRLLNNSEIATYTLVSGFNGVRGCRRQDTVSVRVVDCRPVRDVRFTMAEQTDTICSRTCITYINMTDTMAGGPQTYTWTFSGGSPRISHEQNPTVCYNYPHDNTKEKGYNVVLQVANPYPKIVPTGSAPGSANAWGVLGYIKVVDVPNVTIVSPGQIKSDTTVRFGQAVDLTGSGALTYEWAPAYNISSLTKSKVTVNPFKTTQYILTGYNSRQCYSSDTINVIVVEDCGEMYVPNAFTPNDDGVNDVLYVRGICLQSLTFMVFNRWGEKVFETADQTIGWDGSYKGQALNTGVFVYRLEGKTHDGKGFSSKGNITLLR